MWLRLDFLKKFPCKKLILATIVCLLFLGACDNNNNRSQKVVTEQEQKNIENSEAVVEKEDKNMRFLALGDSYTIGERVAESQRWPVQLVEQIKKKGTKIDNAEIIAKTGWTTDELMEAIAQAKPQGPYDLVSLLIGVNNQYRGRSDEEYRAQFTQLLEQAIAFAGGSPEKVIVLSIPDWGVTEFAKNQGRNPDRIAAEIDLFNKINREQSQNAGVYYIDITAISRRAREDTSLVAEDGLHPAGKMYGEWVEKALPTVEKILAAKEN